MPLRLAILIVAIPFLAGPPLQAAENQYEPAWAGVAPTRVLRHAHSNGDALVKAVAALKPGDQLVLAAGVYSVDRLWDIRVSGSLEAPIWIVADKGASVVFTRSNAKQNVVNIAQDGPVAYLCLRGIEITGGDQGLRLHQCSEVWIDQCHIHHTDGVCLSANIASTRKLFLTRNHIHHGSGHGEGMYLGSHDGEHVMSESVIALNHIHDCGGSQGDGIEIKQGCWGNLIAENDIHDTNYPCIIAYGTGGRPVNIIERNLCRRSGDHAIQVTGEAIVRNNVVIGASGSGFASTDHESKTRNLQVLHNTIINTGRAFSGSSWNGREGLVVANNVLYSRNKEALRFPSGDDGVTIAGNIILGDAPKTGTFKGRGLEDFANLAWDGSAFNAKPTTQAPFDHADARYLLEFDFKGEKRKSATSGALAR
ncbi:MAG TPA: right-handed parallel beta-helix repeat-containing protein [Caulifigura sp.]|nr:right-handed parallel beta-helix repeat-containing protein [Caulifigura sp.]